MPTTVTVGGTAATNVTVVSATEVTATTPAGSASEAVDVVVTTSNGSATLADGFTYQPPPDLELTVPASTDLVVGEQTVYNTHLTNHGGEAYDLTEEIRLSNAAGDLVAADVVYETQDVNQTWKAVEWIEDAGELYVTYTYAKTAAGADHGSDVRITVTRDTGDLTGRSLYTDSGGATLAQADYTFVVTDGGA
jgi:hypothetical protein